jgi:ABC-type transport system involved in multi-copper enzyme maturation permease subunit
MNNVLPLDPASPVSRRSTVAARRYESSVWQRVWAIAMVVVKELYRRKDFYVLFILTALISFTLASVNIFGDDRVVRYLKEVCLLLIWVSSLVIAITTTARQIPAEKENRTLFPLLAKPVSRAQLLLGKFLGCWLAVGLSLGCFYLFFGVLSGLREHSWPVMAYVQAALLHWTMLAVVISMTLLGSIVFAAPSSNGTILLIVSVGILFLGRHLNKMALGLPEPSGTFVYAVYFALPHLELFDVRDLVIHNWGLVPWWAVAGAVGYAAVYSAAFLLLASWRFPKYAVNQ